MNVSARRSAYAARTENDPRWRAVMSRDSSADGAFVYSVKTTGVYCRPSCASRAALPEHVRFHDNGADAAVAGFRACKRCKPDQPSLVDQHTAMVAAACRSIEQSPKLPSLAELAAEAGLSPFHFHRLFRAITGLTPRAYGTAQRGARIRTALETNRTVTRAIYDAGYESSGRFYSAAKELLGMTPTAYRAGGSRMEIRFAIGDCSLGSILVASSTHGICAIFMGDDPELLARNLDERFPHADLKPGDAAFDAVIAAVIGFVDAPRRGLDLPLDVQGTAFQQRVWQALREIPPGSTVTYTDIAQRIGSPNSVRAVAQACGANPVAVAIPCHRVVRSDGAIAGYRWGVERKRALLALEVDR